MARKNTVDKITFSADDICKILKSASEAKVTTLRLGGMHVSFSHGLTQADQPQILEEIPEGVPQAVYYEPEKERIERAKIDEMIISDPVAYEESILSGDLVDEKTQSE